MFTGCVSSVPRYKYRTLMFLFIAGIYLLCNYTSHQEILTYGHRLHQVVIEVFLPMAPCAFGILYLVFLALAIACDEYFSPAWDKLLIENRLDNLATKVAGEMYNIFSGKEPYLVGEAATPKDDNLKYNATLRAGFLTLISGDPESGLDKARADFVWKISNNIDYVIEYVDTNCEGEISQNELINFFAMLEDEPNLTDDEIDMIIASIDSDGTGTITTVEFKRWYHHSEKHVTDHLREIFEKYRTHSCGGIHKSEFRALLSEIDPTATDIQLSQSLDECYTAGQEELLFEEFLKWLRDVLKLNLLNHETNSNHGHQNENEMPLAVTRYLAFFFWMQSHLIVCDNILDQSNTGDIPDLSTESINPSPFEKLLFYYYPSIRISPQDCDVMVSFNTASSGQQALMLAMYLYSHGIKVFCSNLCCPRMVGSWRDAVVEAVINCKKYVPLMTKEWQQSNECQYETQIAEHRRAQKELEIIPVMFLDSFDDEYDAQPGHRYAVKWSYLQSVHKVADDSEDWMKAVLLQLRSEIPPPS